MSGQSSSSETVSIEEFRILYKSLGPYHRPFGKPSFTTVIGGPRLEREKSVVVVSDASGSSEGISPLRNRGHAMSEGDLDGVAPRSSGGAEATSDEHIGLDAVVVETRTTLVSANDLRNIWELFFAPFEREISDALESRNPNEPSPGFSFDFDIIPAKPNESVLDGPPDSFAFYLYPMSEGSLCYSIGVEPTIEAFFYYFQAPKQGLTNWFYIQTRGHGKNRKRLIEPLGDAPKKWKREFFFVVPRAGATPSWWFDSEGEAFFPPKWIEPHTKVPRPKLGDCSDESLRTISDLANLGSPKKLQSLLMVGEDGRTSSDVPSAGGLPTPADRPSFHPIQPEDSPRKHLSPQKGDSSVVRVSSGRSTSSKGAGERRVSERTSKGKSVAVYKDRKPHGPVPPRKLVINEGGEKKRSRDRSPEVSSPVVKKVKTGSSTKDMLADLAQMLPSPPSVVPPGAEKEIPLLSYDPAVHVRVGERSMAPMYPELDDYLVYKSDRSLYRSEYDAASLIRNRMSCFDDRSALEKLVRSHGPWALRDLLGKEMLRMCSTYAAFVETEEKMVGWYKDRLEEVSDAHQECLVLTRKLEESEKAVNDLTSERDRLKLEKETAVANMEVLRTKMSGFELEANNLKEQNKCMSERNDKVLEENLKLSEDPSMVTSARDKLAADVKGYLDLSSQNQKEIDDLRRALEVAQEDHKSAVLGAKESIDWAWNNCLDQVKLLNPSLPIVFDGMDVYLSVVDGKLVSATSPEEEGADKEDEGKEVIDVEKIGPFSEVSLSLAHLFEEAAKDPSIAGSFPSDEPTPSKVSPGDPAAVGAEPTLPNDPSVFPLAVVHAPSAEEGPRSVGDDYFHGYDAAF
ncbi:hypothetical protein G2W53_020437 [Senna tora]|uniref:Uncharacterized protein n=1 Tax=Senna tora TaxID=362788 RepID=A0A834TVF4_9FABA|nr:hypothetical protein G2W53_020437 [Senna tora]